MNLQQAKDQVAKKHGRKTFYALLCLTLEPSKVNEILGEVAELYARSKWDEACEEYQYELADHYVKHKDYRIHDDATANFVITTPKPEFKP